jgi:hypothetical protein
MSDLSGVNHHHQGEGDDVVAFASYPNHEEYDLEPSRLLQIRREIVDCASLADIRFFGEHEHSDRGRLSAVRAIVIERSMLGTADVLVHTYGISPLVVDHLEKTYINVLLEDAAIIKFAIQSDLEHRHAPPSRVSVHRGVSSLKRENAELRQKLRDTASPSSHVMKAQKASSNSEPQASESAQESARADVPVVSREGVHTAPTAGGAATLPLHSPLSWDMETDAMVNARTAYNAYRQRTTGGVNVRLDAVTQQQMVARLHDQSVDLRDRKRRENELLVMRELGLQERRELTLSDQQEMAQRLHDQTIARAKKNMDKLKEMYVPPLPKRSLSPQQQKESAKRMHDEAMAHARATNDQLFKDYVLATDLEKKKLSLDAQKQMADRLSKRAAAA